MRNAAMFVAAFALAAGVALSQLPKDSAALPPPYATRSVNNHPRVVDKPAAATLKLPQGFHAEVWAEGFERPRFMALGPSGEVLLSDSAEGEIAAVGSKGKPGSEGAVYVFPKGRADARRKLLGGLDRPYGLAFWKNYLYVAEPESIQRFPYDSAKMTAGQGQEVVSLKGFRGGHWTRSLLFDRQGAKLYVGVGSASNVDTGEDSRRAAINRYNPDGTGHEVYASGTRNPIGLRWAPGTDTLWAAVQERDALGDELVPDYFTHIQQGAFYGWPYAYFGPNPDPRHKGEREDLVKKTVKPDTSLGSHVAVLDFIFYTGNQFPDEYKGGAFLALHGSWNRSKRVGYSVAFIPFRNSKPAGEPRDFLTGWMLSPDDKRVWGRPVGLLQLPDGSLLLSDDGGNKVWHIWYGR